jgi:ribosomal protein L21E
MGLSYRIIYKQGKENRVADALSRTTHAPDHDLTALSTVTSSWVHTLQESYTQDPDSSKLLQELAIQSPSGKFSLNKGLIYFNSRIWIGNIPEIQQQILFALHSSAVGGHSGFEATYNRIKRLFAWPHQKQTVKDYVAQCMVCQQAKTERVASPGLLSPLPIPDGSWKVITMDFIEGLPRSQSYNCILVVVDRFSKYAHFLPLSHPFTALQVAILFMNNIFKLHGLPQAIISDRDKIFTSHLWRELFKLIGTNLQMSSAYHPQTDGQSERVNQCLETYLRCFVNSSPTKWSSWLPLAEFWYNTSSHSSLGNTPFYVLYGHHPSALGLDIPGSSDHSDLDSWLKDRDLMQQLAQQHLLRAQRKMKIQADKHRSFRTFQIGDSVFVKIQPYVQTSLATRSSNKLSYRYFGPFKVVAKINDVAYQLQLPVGCLIHPVFHVSQLK